MTSSSKRSTLSANGPQLSELPWEILRQIVLDCLDTSFRDLVDRPPVTDTPPYHKTVINVAKVLPMFLEEIRSKVIAHSKEVLDSHKDTIRILCACKCPREILREIFGPCQSCITVLEQSDVWQAAVPPLREAHRFLGISTTNITYI